MASDVGTLIRGAAEQARRQGRAWFVCPHLDGWILLSEPRGANHYRVEPDGRVVGVCRDGGRLREMVIARARPDRVLVVQPAPARGAA